MEGAYIVLAIMVALWIVLQFAARKGPNYYD